MIFRYFNYQQKQSNIPLRKSRNQLRANKGFIHKKTERDILNITQEDGAKPVQNLIQCSEIIFLFPEAAARDGAERLSWVPGVTQRVTGWIPRRLVAVSLPLTE